jgi:hypothetical protein
MPGDAFGRRGLAGGLSVSEGGTSAGEAEPFPDWFIRMTKPGVNLDAAIDENRTPHEGVDL